MHHPGQKVYKPFDVVETGKVPRLNSSIGRFFGKNLAHRHSPDYS